MHCIPPTTRVPSSTNIVSGAHILPLEVLLRWYSYCA